MQLWRFRFDATSSTVAVTDNLLRHSSYRKASHQRWHTLFLSVIKKIISLYRKAQPLPSVSGLLRWPVQSPPTWSPCTVKQAVFYSWGPWSRTRSRSRSRSRSRMIYLLPDCYLQYPDRILQFDSVLSSSCQCADTTKHVSYWVGKSLITVIWH